MNQSTQKLTTSLSFSSPLLLFLLASYLNVKAKLEAVRYVVTDKLVCFMTCMRTDSPALHAALADPPGACVCSVLTTTSRAALAAGSKKQKQVIKKWEDRAVVQWGREERHKRTADGLPFAYFSIFFLFFLPLF